jgi:ABC-type multidrug transport system ATPase subunit
MDEIAENCTRATVFAEGKIVATETPKKLFESTDVALQAGLDIPFTAKTLQKMRTLGVVVDCNLTTDDFVAKTLLRAKTGGAGMRLTEEGGQNHA